MTYCAMKEKYYGRKLEEAGVTVPVLRYNGVIHDFGLLNPLAETPAIRDHALQGGAELSSHLKQQF